MHSCVSPSRALPWSLPGSLSGAQFNQLPAGRLKLSACLFALSLAFSVPLFAQEGSPAQAPTSQPAQPASASQPALLETSDSAGGAITEDEIRQLVQGKSLYLRGGYLDNSLSFNEYGRLIGHSPKGSYTLNLIQIDKVRLSKHKLELLGVRYGLHFLGTMANEDPTKAVDKVRITPKKKLVKITVDREQIMKPRKKKGRRSSFNDAAESSTRTPDEMTAGPASHPESEAAAPPVFATNSPAHAAWLLREALANIFANGLDQRMIAAMPEFWELYYQAVDSHSDYHPAGVFRQSEVDQKAKLLSNIEAPSNEYAQNGGVGGMALYHAVIGADGKPQAIAVGRPIGFGLDENAVNTISQASFQPAIKDGKPVPVLLDLLVQFRIFSKRTATEDQPETAEKPAGPVLPGPYSVHP